MSVLLQQLVDCVFYLFITNIKKIFSVRSVNNVHYLIIHGKSILYQYQSLIILSQSVGVNTKVILVIDCFKFLHVTLSTEHFWCMISIYFLYDTWIQLHQNSYIFM